MQMLYSRDTISISELLWTSLQNEAKCKAFHETICFVCIGMKTNFHHKTFARSPAFTTRLKTTWKWLIALRKYEFLFFLRSWGAHIYHITVCFESQHHEGVMTGRFLKEHVASIFPQINIFYSIEFWEMRPFNDKSKFPAMLELLLLNCRYALRIRMCQVNYWARMRTLSRHKLLVTPTSRLLIVNSPGWFTSTLCLKDHVVSLLILCTLWNNEWNTLSGARFNLLTPFSTTWGVCKCTPA